MTGSIPRALPSSTVSSISARRVDRPMHAAVQRAIAVMNSRYCEPITLTGLAAEVFVSPFHFSRLFSKATGITPGRYLTAVRLFEAKRLLLTTSLTVSDIVCTVGYSSVGTFTSRFSQAVGLTPSQFRDPDVNNLMLAIAPHFQRLPTLAALRDAGRGCAGAPRGSGSITARLELPVAARPGNVLVGVFADVIPQCGPVAFTGLQDTGSVTVTLENVPPGRWTVIAASEQAGIGPAAVSELLLGRSRAPVTIVGGESATVGLRIRALQPTDPPIAITLAARTERRTPPADTRAMPLRRLDMAA